MSCEQCKKTYLFSPIQSKCLDCSSYFEIREASKCGKVSCIINKCKRKAFYGKIKTEAIFCKEHHNLVPGFNNGLTSSDIIATEGLHKMINITILKLENLLKKSAEDIDFLKKENKRLRENMDKAKKLL